MANPSKRKSDAARRANQVVRSRTVLMMAILGIATFVVLFWKLYDIQIRQHSVLQEKAIEQQTRSAVVNASRGTVYDRNLNTLAISATAEDVASNQRQGRVKAMTRQEKSAEIARLEKAMKEAAKMLEFELAATLRDQIIELRGK